MHLFVNVGVFFNVFCCYFCRQWYWRHKGGGDKAGSGISGVVVWEGWLLARIAVEVVLVAKVVLIKVVMAYRQ